MCMLSLCLQQLWMHVVSCFLMKIIMQVAMTSSTIVVMSVCLV